MRVANGDAGGQVDAPPPAVLNHKVPLVVLVEVPSHLAGETTIRTFFDLSTRHCGEAVPLLEALRRESPGDCTEQGVDTSGLEPVGRRRDTPDSQDGSKLI